MWASLCHLVWLDVDPAVSFNPNLFCWSQMWRLKQNICKKPFSMKQTMGSIHPQVKKKRNYIMIFELPFLAEFSAISLTVFSTFYGKKVN